MTEKPGLPAPTIEWNDGEFRVSFPLENGTLDARWRPGITTVIRIRESGTDAWSPGFETPLNSFSLVGLAPDTEYEVRVTRKNAAGEGPPVIRKLRAEPDGDTGNIVPFPGGSSPGR